MAPPNGHLLLPKIWRAARFAYEKASKAIRSKLPEPQYNSLRYQPAYARINRQPISRAAAIRQARSRHFSTRAAGAFTSAIRSTFGAEGTAHATSRIASNISRLSSRAPFASTLRPNLTGGTLGRTAGGYAVGAGRFGGARYFSHGPAAPAQVIQNVSQGVRAFFLSGQKVRFDGIDPNTGEKRYKAVTVLQDQAERKMNSIPRSAPGSYLDFQVSPTITAFGALSGLGQTSSAPCDTLNSDGLMDLLSADFARALKDFAAIMNDLKRLSSLGDLPVTLHDRSTIRVRFPGCDADTVERLCDEAGVQRGRIVQDEDFDLRTGADMALLFPFAPSIAPSSDTDYYFEKAPKMQSQYPQDLDWHGMMTPSSPGISRDSGNAISFEDSQLYGANPWRTSSQSYSSINVSELGDQPFFPELSSAGLPESTSAYEGVEGIYKFLAECDRAQRS
ncbi:uncharacterized protein N7446_013563 [Penicillium canescens]|uniref:Casein kinase II beta 2 subunit n=1 Tax=Penicillium canescens TaxID=5083 RepID=A0AAD6I0G7_PENCN|nr:uncharacterized protein N7446_013563 [Penicillium canescens]KAJ6023203.1 hypothetical protein N7460_013598 [Penicillium canescens]KAJ6025529.1 hypothetical protein N7444_013208 [Penicillium canescens]KAJ6042497.1 hypothetical protein N7446_013563 [Penicillium canescens]